MSSWQNVGTSPNDYTEILFDADNLGHCIDDCQTACFRIKACTSPDVPIAHTISVADPSNPDPCTPAPSTSFKPIQRTGESNIAHGEANYPNPITVETWYKTTIPFVTYSIGTAVITILNESGQLVFHEAQEITAKGRHAFYFSGERLPTGKYYYRIESPKGVPVVERTMLIVK
jgi:hypothetical protein